MPKKITLGFILFFLFLMVHAKAHAAACQALSATQPTVPVSTTSGGTYTGYITITYTCDANLNITVGIDQGVNYQSTRKLLKPAPNADTIPYTIKTPGGVLWGYDAAGTHIGGPWLTATATGASTSLIATIDLTIPSGQRVGTYTDTLTITIKDTAGNPLISTSVNFTPPPLISGCTVSATPGPINFGAFPSGATVSLSQNATIGITCVNATSYYWGANAGINWSGSTRRMIQGTADFIAYDLKTNGVLLGDGNIGTLFGGTPTTGTINMQGPKTANGYEQSYTINAIVTTTLPAAIGTYTDTVMYTIGWQF